MSTETLIPDGDINAGTTGFITGGGVYYIKIDEGVASHDGSTTMYNSHNANDDEKYIHFSLPTPVGTIRTSGSFTVKAVMTIAWGTSATCIFHLYENGSLLASSSNVTVDGTVDVFREYEITGISASGVTDKTTLELRQEVIGSGGQQIRTTAIDVIAPIAAMSDGASVAYMLMGSGG